MNMTKLLLLLFCLSMMLLMSSCQKEEISLNELSQQVEEGTWNFNRGYDRFTLKKIVFADGEMTISYDDDLNGTIDYNWSYKYFIRREFHNTYLHLLPISANDYQEWCRFELRDELLYLYFKKGEVLFTIDREGLTETIIEDKL